MEFGHSHMAADRASQMKGGYVVKWSPDDTPEVTPWKIVRVEDCVLSLASCSFYRVHKEFLDCLERTMPPQSGGYHKR